MKNMESQMYAVVDLETTGHSSKQGDRIIQIAIVFMRDWQIEKTYTSFVNPKRKIPHFIQDLTHIKEEDVKHAEPFEAIAHEVYDMLQDCVFVAHNIDFDLPFLQEEFKRCGLPKWFGKSMDTVELAKILYPTAYSYKLSEIALELNIGLENAHRADDDAMATARLLKKCFEQLMSLPLETIQHLHTRSFKLKSGLAHLFFEALQIKRTKSSQLQHHFLYRGVPILQPQQQKIDADPVIYPASTEAKTQLFSKVMTHFEVREGQFNMMDTVWNSLQHRTEILTEASTGIGKTLAYLIPSIVFAKQQKQPVVISTYTSHLLDQLIQEELPKAKELLGCDVRIAVLKGMEHYIDLDRFIESLVITEDSYDENFVKMQVLVWLAISSTGDLNEVNVSGGGRTVLDRIRRTSTTAETKQQNAFDFYLEAMKSCEEAELIITNHAMLLADLERETPIVQQVVGFILDEGHQMIQAATMREEKVFAYHRFKYCFGQIGHFEDRALHHAFYRLLQQADRVPLRYLSKLENQFFDMIDVFEHAMNHLVSRMNLSASHGGSQKKTILLNTLTLKQPLLEEVGHMMEQWLQLAHEVTRIFKSYQDDLEPSKRVWLTDWEYWLRDLQQLLEQWRAIFNVHEQNRTSWIEADRRSLPNSIQIYDRPIQIADHITQAFDQFRGRDGIIWASGTLTVPGNPRFIADQLGLSREVALYQFQAPAHYYKGANMYIVDDMPDIQQVPQSAYIEAVAEAVTQAVLATEGRCFVLFTSQDMLRKTVDLIQEIGALEDYMIFAQGISTGSRMRLLKMFQRFERSVLFGTNSFWEGVDVPGDALSAVIVVRLPFSAPEEPLFKAKADKMQQQGLNAFYKLSLPEAILRFKQGFGRLIRSSQDKGAFIVLDRRIETKSYGPDFLRALPNVEVRHVSLSELVFDLEDWYNK